MQRIEQVDRARRIGWWWSVRIRYPDHWWMHHDNVAYEDFTGWTFTRRGAERAIRKVQ